LASNLVQADMDTLFTAASTTDGSTPGGPYNVIGTSTGEFQAARLSSSFEKNLASVIALAEFLIANTSDPSASSTRQIECRRQRKTLKDLLAAAATRIGSAANGSVDDRASVSNRAIDRMIVNFNKNNRPDVAVS